MKTFVIHLDLSPHCVYNCLIIDSIFVFIKINLQEVDEQMLLSKQRPIVQKLRELRATSPTLAMVSRLDKAVSTPKRSPSAPPPPSPGPVATHGFLSSSPSTPAPMPIHPVDSPSTLVSSAVQCMSCTALEKRVEGLELDVRQLQATMSLQHDSSTATSSAALDSPSQYLNTGPAPSTQPQSSELFSNLFFREEDLNLTEY